MVNWYEMTIDLLVNGDAALYEKSITNEVRTMYRVRMGLDGASYLAIVPATP